MLEKSNIKVRGERDVTNPVTLEEADKLYNWLQGEPIEGFDFKSQPQLTPDEAFSVIYYLQEELGVIPDIYEQCVECKRLYDSDYEGTFVSDEEEQQFEVSAGPYCDDCRPD